MFVDVDGDGDGDGDAVVDAIWYFAVVQCGVRSVRMREILRTLPYSTLLYSNLLSPTLPANPTNQHYNETRGEEETRRGESRGYSTILSSSSISSLNVSRFIDNRFRPSDA